MSARDKRNSIAAKKKLACWRCNYLLSVLGAGAFHDQDQVR